MMYSKGGAHNRELRARIIIGWRRFGLRKPHVRVVVSGPWMPWSRRLLAVCGVNPEAYLGLVGKPCY